MDLRRPPTPNDHSLALDPADVSTSPQLIQSHPGFEIILLVLLFVAFAFSSCAKRESAAERDAEIERRVDQRLQAEHQAEEEQRLAQHQAALDARERALAAREAFFLTMTSSLAQESASAPADLRAAPGADSYPSEDSYSAPDSYSAYPDVSNEIYPEDDGYISTYEPAFVASPDFFPPTTAYLTILNQNARIVYQRRNRARAQAGQRHFRPSGGPRAMEPRNPIRKFPRPRLTAPRPASPGSAHRNASHRPANSAAIPGNR